jgi:hypothetical protein
MNRYYASSANLVDSLDPDPGSTINLDPGALLHLASIEPQHGGTGTTRLSAIDPGACPSLKDEKCGFPRGAECIALCEER